MIAQSFAVLMLASAALVAGVPRDFSNVDPNTLSCDPHGLVFLLLPHFEECDKYYMCSHGKEVEFTCPGGTIFNFILQTCDWAWATKCWLREIIEEIEGSGEESGDFEWFSSDNAHGNAALVPSSGQVDNVKVATPTKFSAILDCSNPSAAVRQLPYKGDCQRYWRCIDGLPQSVYCSDGLFFNEKSQQCDFEGNVKCNVNHEDELTGEFIVYK
ncbi:protein obstructor-E-like [Pectinophora gossypiella]|uniref:Chitin-binding type-2 domain-containing protein n=1 Tax=Pectinophora gossypiella TaxID=13191 RepID=A0A1E1W2G1_PECGO|nr:protein obstructor-E-like [Pectinophora gossypiella]